MSRRLRRESVAYPYSEEFGAIGDAVAREMFGLKGGDSSDFSIDPRTGSLVRGQRAVAPVDQDPESAAVDALKAIKRNMLDSGGRVSVSNDLSGSSYGFSVPRVITDSADAYSIDAAEAHGVTVIRLSSTTDRSFSRYVFTNHEYYVRLTARLQGFTSKVLYQPT